MTTPPRALKSARMLQDNTSPAAGDHARHAHAAHAAMVSLHALCCGAPVALSLLSIGAATAAGGFVFELHHLLHAHELWLLALSALLVSIGGYAEWRAFRAGQRRVPLLYVVSIACFVANAAIIAGHRI